MVMIEAVRRGTVTGKEGIFHVDPDGRRPEARKRAVPAVIAEKLVAKGLARIIKTRMVEDGEDAVGAGADGVDVVDVAAPGTKRRAKRAPAEEKAVPAILGMGGGSTRDTTNFQRDPLETTRTGGGSEVEAVAEGDEGGNGDGEGDGSDADAPPADPETTRSPRNRAKARAK